MCPKCPGQSLTVVVPAYVFLHVKQVLRLSAVPIAGSARPPLMGRPLSKVPGLVTSHTDIAFCGRGGRAEAGGGGRVPCIVSDPLKTKREHPSGGWWHTAFVLTLMPTNTCLQLSQFTTHHQMTCYNTFTPSSPIAICTHDLCRRKHSKLHFFHRPDLRFRV